MNDSAKKILARLSTVEKTPDFADFFAKFATHPPQHIKKGAILFSEDDLLDKLYFIKEGFVHLYRLSEEGKKQPAIYLAQIIS